MFVLCAFQLPSLTQSKAERQHVLLWLVLGFQILKVTSGSIIKVGFIEVLRILCTRGDRLYSEEALFCFGMC